MPNFLYLPGWEQIDVEELDEQFVITAEYRPEPQTCAKCGVVGQLYRHGPVPRAYRDEPSHGLPVTIKATRYRYKCRACDSTFLQPLPDMEEKHRMTVRCREYIAEQALREPFTKVAEEVGVDEKTVRQIADEHITALNATYRPEAPRVLGIDELTLDGKLRVMLTDIDRRCIIDLLESFNKATVVRWLSFLPGRENIRCVSMDMSGTFFEAVRAVLKDVPIVADKFHVVRKASGALDMVRKEIGREKSDKDRRKLMRGRHILMKRPHRLTPEQAFKLDGWLANDDYMKAAYEAKERFYGIWEAETKAEAAEAIDAWLATLPEELDEPFHYAKTALQNWRAEILAYWDFTIIVDGKERKGRDQRPLRVTNAYTEAANGITKIANRRGRGYTFEVIRARALFRGSDAIQRARMACEICKAPILPELRLLAEVMLQLPADTKPRPAVLCASCMRFHTDRWFKRHGRSTQKSE